MEGWKDEKGGRLESEAGKARKREGKKVGRLESEKGGSWIGLELIGFTFDWVPTETICPNVPVKALSQKIITILFYVINIDFGEGIEYFCSILNL